MNPNEKKEHRRVVLLLWCISILLLIILFTSIFYIRSTRVMRQAKAETIEIAEKYTDLETIDAFYWFTRGGSSFSLTGTDKQGKEIVVIVPESGDKALVLNQQDGLTEADARSQISQEHPEETIQKATLGLFEEEPAWEIMTKNSEGQLNYYLIKFTDGTEINTINNI